MSLVLKTVGPLAALALAGNAAGQGAPPPPSAPAWKSQCSSDARAATPQCAVQGVASMAKPNLTTLITLMVGADGKAELSLQTPLGVSLPAGVGISIDGAAVRPVPLVTCIERGCVASTPAGPDLVAALKAGKTLSVVARTVANQPLSFDVTLTGFSAAYDKVR